MTRDAPYARLRHGVFLAYGAAMVLVLLTPIPRASRPPMGGLDKLVHIGVFFGFTLMYEFDLKPSVVRALLVSFAFAGVIELLQVALPYRSGDWWDFLAGAVGSMAGLLAASLVRRQ
ncbi:MAG: VanZ family protein [Gemmatimonadaceae bacterium]